MATRTKDVQTDAEELVTAKEARAPAKQPLTLPADDPVAFPLQLPQSKARLQTPAVGQRATRPDGRLHGLGQTQYIDDLTFPHMIHAKVLRSEHAHARIVSIDTSAAEAMPGVLATLTGKEIPRNSFGPTLQDQPVLADDVVRHRGDGVAAVAAVTEQLATDALEKIKVVYEPLQPVFDPLEALGDDAPRIHGGDSNIYASKVIKKGDVEKAFAAACLYRVLGRQWPRLDLVEPGPDHARSRGPRAHAGASAKQDSPDRYDRRRQLRRQKRDHQRTDPRDAVAKNR